jgi:hypothetical protein
LSDLRDRTALDKTALHFLVRFRAKACPALDAGRNRFASGKRVKSRIQSPASILSKRKTAQVGTASRPKMTKEATAPAAIFAFALVE